jgi:hypothetical protein
VEIRLFCVWIFCLCICVSCGLDERRGEGFPDRSGEFLGYVDGYLDTVSLFQRSRRYIQYVQDQILRLSTLQVYRQDQTCAKNYVHILHFPLCDNTVRES